MSVLEGFALVWLGVILGVLITWIFQELRFRLALRRLVREASKATQEFGEVMW